MNLNKVISMVRFSYNRFSDVFAINSPRENTHDLFAVIQGLYFGYARLNVMHAKIEMKSCKTILISYGFVIN